MNLSNVHFDPRKPYWQDYLPYLEKLAGPDFPDCESLNGLLQAELSSEAGQAIRFVPSELLDDDGYEHRIYTTGQVSTRSENWHDLFNAMVWLRFPQIKLAMNSLHYHAIGEQKDGCRGRLRDALTLFDECGVIVLSDQPKILTALAKRRWKQAFLADGFQTSVKIMLCGHAMLEKYLTPYKSMTAKALLISIEPGFLKIPRAELIRHLDLGLAGRLRQGTLLNSPACLSPLPLAGIPGWWPLAGQEDDMFYADLEVFRPPPVKLAPTAVISM